MLKVRHILLLAIIFIANISFGQDQMYLKDGTIKDTEIIEVGTKEIAYRLASNSEGPIYKIRRRDVYFIIYANGTQEYLNKVSSADDIKSKNIISLNYGDLIFMRAAVSYERLFSNGNFGLKIPISVSIDNDRGRYNDYVQFQSGVDFNYYPLGQRRLTYYTGLSSRIGSYRDTFYGIYYYDQGISSPVYHDKFFGSTYVSNGLIFNLTPQFCISGMFGLGFRYIDNGRSGIEEHGIGELNVSFRF